ncbi:MAG: [LysW]-aminoadipate/[LysW]-glutamate kinase [Candidatus Wukongarchaeota archaeon]|nr:[LysW]-aminoadipate/[LysW]-glutamate kinase [Candidatus Wukongarchaeota archaeon]
MLVIKIGGSLLEEDLENFYDDWIGDILVHGGAKKVTEIAEKLGVKQEFIVSPSGFKSRHTDEKTLEIFTMVLSGLINKKLVIGLLSKGHKAVGFSGIDGEVLKAQRKKGVLAKIGEKVVRVEDFSGNVIGVNTELLKLLVSNGYVPVIASVAYGEGVALNVDGDRSAAKVAVETGAEKLLILTDVEGVLIKGDIVPKIKLYELDEYIDEVGAGMKKKLLAAKEALEGGVKEVIISSGKKENPISQPTGTRVIR